MKTKILATVIFLSLLSLTAQPSTRTLLPKQASNATEELPGLASAPDSYAYEVTLPEAGLLKDYITLELQEKITSLKIIGNINGDDLRIIRHMIGAQISSADGIYAQVDSGNCRNLDLSQARIVAGGCYTFVYVPYPEKGPAYYLPGLKVKTDTIDYAMFCGRKIQKLILPHSVKYIGSTIEGSSFEHSCIDGAVLGSVTLPDKLEHFNIYGTDEILRHRSEGPDYYESTPQSNLLNSPCLSEILISDANEYFATTDNLLYSKNFSKLLFCPQKRTNSFTIPNSTKLIGAYAFYKCKIDGDIIIPPNIDDVEEHAFLSMTCNGDMTISAHTLLPLSFSNVVINGDLHIGDRNIIIAESAFIDSKIKNKLTIGNGVESIGKHAFLRVAAADFSDFPSSLKHIGDEAFYDSMIPGKVTLGPNLTQVGYAAFYQSGFSQAIVDTQAVFGTAHYNHSYSYQVGNGHTSYTAGSPCEVDAAWTFFKCSRLENVHFGSNIVRIPDEMFYECNNLKTITFDVNGKLEHIGAWAFCKSTSLVENFTLPKSLKSIGKFAFQSYAQNQRTFLMLAGTESPMNISNCGIHPNDKVFLWIDDNHKQLPVGDFDSWLAAGQDFYYNMDPKTGDYQPYAYTESYDWTGELYVPEGWLSFVNNSETLYQGISWIRPSFRHEIEMYAYPYCSLFPKPDGVMEIHQDCTDIYEVARYDITGKRISAPISGINIILFNNGLVRKEFIR